ncbi:hypothetical protein LTR05_005937 [Lithohypha guttulata]|uniref:CENP-V/GFA domain-containing protein n=1 Tax=Lithohypha guttulata TaxID=1690604 RepID=A0AAN7SXL8_9EURO|nr:hypothetical protein LTR05_005937 [Lithohypha guttulata]
MPNKHNNKEAVNEHIGKDQSGAADEAHQFQAGNRSDRKEDEWKHRAPYKIHDDDSKFPAKWKGGCHCGKVKYELSREKPLASKRCHCHTCQRLHGAPFQWACIFHKDDINFVNGIHDIGWYDPSGKSNTHHLPCKVSCAFCRTPIMDEGRNMILLFPTLIEGIEKKEVRDNFKPTCHMFYNERAVDFTGDGIVKWDGIDNKSNLVDDDGNVLVKYEDGMEEKEMDEKKRKYFDGLQDSHPETARKEKDLKI